MRANPNPPVHIPPKAGKHELHRGDTLFLSGRRGGERGSPRSGWTLPPHLQDQLPRRLRNVAFLYALAYFLSAFGPDILTGRFAQAFRESNDWIVSAASIVTGVAVGALAFDSRVSWRSKMNLGLLFEVLGGYGIALSMYVRAERFADTPIVFFAVGPSWVAIWMIVYSIVVPAP